MSEEYSKHCLLQKGNIKTTAWIPEAFAKKGKYVTLQQDDGDWDDGWQVLEIGTRQPAKYLLERSQDYKNTRKASDI